MSIGIVTKDSRTFYAESASFDEHKADQWVKDNVLSKLLYRKGDIVSEIPFNGCKVTHSEDSCSVEVFGTDSVIANSIKAFIGNDPNPKFYAYYAPYDWVVFCRLFGRMIDLPKNFPMYVIDLKQMMEERGLSKEWKQDVCPDLEGEHNALVDAKWNMKIYDKIMQTTNP